MPLFQISVVNKYLKAQNEKAIHDAYAKFSNHFLNPSMQKEIMEMNEDEYQDGFLEDLFVNVLGYIKRPKKDYNLIREKKNATDGKKADGAILFNNTPIAVIELKGSDTKNLDKITNQAFGYKNNHSNCNYVITSNFEKLRFFIHNAVEYIEFNLFSLTKEDFFVLWFCLRASNLLNNIPLKAKEESIVVEENITSKLYKDYATFKTQLWQNICKNDPEKDQLLQFKKTQKLLDRFLFILFAEDSGLLPPNSITRMVERYEKLIELDAYKPLYEIIKQYFSYINQGRKGKTPQNDILAYNGGLFLPDFIIDDFKIDDDILKKNLIKLTTYNFLSEIDVNILGHIFENSLKDIENVTAMLRGQEIDKRITKRRKDGVFYTPKYITKYIVDNTLGKLCEEKKTEIGVIDDEYAKGRRNRKKNTIKKLDSALQAYRKWLLNITICDPACGSGAFINQALEYLIKEHAYIDELNAQLMGASIVFQDVRNHILEKNIYGVDINDESVEIAKLSLWLRTAQRGRKLTSLNNNIKCGNSLIDNSKVAGEKAFNWQQEFSEVFKNGGFDIIIGNPPYIKEYTARQAFNGLHDHPCYQGKMDLWYFFGWLALKIIKPETGLIGFIAPNNWITNAGASIFRNNVLEDGKIIEFVDFGDFKVFDDAGIQTMIYIMKKSNDNEVYSVYYSKILNKKITKSEAVFFLQKFKNQNFTYFKSIINKTEFLNNFILFNNHIIKEVLDKIKFQKDFYLNKNEIAQGIVAPQDSVNTKSQNILGSNFDIGNGIFVISQTEYENLHLQETEKELVKPFYNSSELLRYFGESNNKFWIIYTNSKFKNEAEMKSYPNLKNHLDKFREVITSDNKPYGLHRAREENFFKGNKIISIRKCSRPTFTYTDFDCYVSQSYYILKTKKVNLKALTIILNSKLIEFWLRYKGKMQGDIFQIDKEPLLNLPLKKINNPHLFIEKANQILLLNKDLQQTRNNFNTLLRAKFKIARLTNKLQNWYKLKFSEFLKELEKIRKATDIENQTKYTKLRLSEEAEWMQYFNNQKREIKKQKLQIQKTEKEIDRMVYSLYNLTDNEIKIIKGK